VTRFLLWLIGRTPIGWLQLASNKLRFAAAGTGVAFACILVFVQLGMMGAFRKATGIPYQALNADIMISASDANGLADGSNVARRRMFQAIAVPGSREALPVFIGKAIWLQEDGSKIELTVIGIDPTRQSFVGPAVSQAETLKLFNNAMVDRRSRGLKPQQLDAVTPDNPLVIEVNHQQISIAGTISLGGGFAGDGFMVVSEQTFLRLFPSRSSGAPNHILLNIEAGEDAYEVSARIRKSLAAESIMVRPFSRAIEDEITYQTTRRPVGLIFGFGVAIGTIVGLVIVYQILSTDVADHLSEYATFKAMGYRQKFFRSVVLEEAVILALVGFFPALLVTMGIYSVMAKATGLPIAMSPERAAMVLVGTILSCALSGFLAMRKLANADPADLF
jgi:putative ABC transport system permease protein